jgi:hypothetical protein
MRTVALRTLLLSALALAGVPARGSGFLRSAEIPRTLDELWAGYDEFDRATPMEPEVLKAWEEDGIVCRVVRYQVGVFKGVPARIAGFYAFPKGGTNLPAILQMHGGGQSASLDSVTAFARNGYAGLSINWGGNKLNFGRAKVTYDGPQTDWGRLDATHPPQRNKANHFAGALTPDDYTLDAVESPRNSNWFLVLVAARRAVTFLQQQPEVDPARIGACGHSMGGKLTTNLAGIDARVKAAVPSCGGSGDILESQTDLPGCAKKNVPALELACVSDNAYIPRIACPILWLSPANDFHAHIDHMAWNWRNVPDDRVRFSIAPHLNHRHTDEHAITQILWFEQHLKGAFTMPRTPRLVLDLTTPDGVPALTVTPDATMPVRRVDLYHAVDPHELTRFWRDAPAVPTGGSWRAACPVLSLDQPIFAYANVVYDTPPQYRRVAHAPGQGDTDTFVLSSRVLSVAPAALRAAGVRATDAPDRRIDDGSRGWRDWYLLNWGHAPLWHAATRKLKDPKWRGPDGARLAFEIRCETDNTLVVTFNCNAWGAFRPGKPAVDYAAVREIKGSPDWQTVSVGLADLAAADPAMTAPLESWQTVTEFSLSPSGTIVRDGTKVKIDGRPWQGPREIRNLRWEGGEYKAGDPVETTLNPDDDPRNFNEAIRKSMGARPGGGELLLAGGLRAPAAVPDGPVRVERLASPVLFRGDASTAYRDPTAVYHGGWFRLFFTLVRVEPDGTPYSYVAWSRSRDLVRWTAPVVFTPRDRRLNYGSPGSIVRDGDDWVLCLQTYPRPDGEMYGNRDARLWTMRSRDLEAWSPPELLRVKGPDVPQEAMGRMIDPFLVAGKDEPGTWWCFFKQNGVSLARSRDLRTWTFAGRADAGENACVIVDGGDYVLFHSPPNGIGVKRSGDLKTWRDEGVLTLGQKDWPWAQGRLTAGFVLDLRREPAVGRALMFFHGSDFPETDPRGGFDNFASLGLAWSDDLKTWRWPGQSPSERKEP